MAEGVACHPELLLGCQLYVSKISPIKTQTLYWLQPFEQVTMDLRWHNGPAWCMLPVSAETTVSASEQAHLPSNMCTAQLRERPPLSKWQSPGTRATVCACTLGWGGGECQWGSSPQASLHSDRQTISLSPSVPFFLPSFLSSLCFSLSFLPFLSSSAPSPPPWTSIGC